MAGSAAYCHDRGIASQCTDRALGDPLLAAISARKVFPHSTADSREDRHAHWMFGAHSIRKWNFVFSIFLARRVVVDPEPLPEALKIFDVVFESQRHSQQTKH